MKICLVAPNFAPEFIGCGKYSTDIAEVLAGDGHNVTVLTGNPHYPNIENFRTFDGNSEEKFNFNLIRVQKNLGRYAGLKGKLLDALNFGLGVHRYFKNNNVDKLDKVIIIAPYIMTVLFCRKIIKNKIPIHLHIQDNEILYLEKKMKIFSWFSNFFKKLIFSKVSTVSTISIVMSHNIQKYIKGRKVKLIRNWADSFDDNNILNRTKEFKIFYPDLYSDLTSGKKIVLYSGNIGQKQGLDICLEAIEVLKEHNARLIIVGDGSGLKVLMEQFKPHGDLIKFHSFVAKKHLDILLNSADVTLVPQLKEVEDLVFPSKLHNILASETEVLVGCSPGSELHNLQTYNGERMYWTYRPEDIRDFKMMLSCSLSSPNRGSAHELVQTEMHMQTNARKFVE